MTRRDSAAAESGATRVAGALRSAPPALDELTRARMERRLLERAPSERSSHVSWLDRGKQDRRGRIAWAAGGALVAAAAALAIGWIVWPRGAPIGSEGPVARFTIDGPGEGASGEVRVGGSLEVGAGERASVQVGHAEIGLVGAGAVDREGADPEGVDRGMVRFASLDARDVRLELTSGRVDVAFHPVERGRERLTIETPSARVEVVGTVFSVRIEHGATRVAVSEGIVRVVPHGADASAVMVRAGESVAVREGGAARVDTGTETGIETATATETAETGTAETETVETGTVAAGRRASVRGQVASEVAVSEAPALEVAAAEYAPQPAEVDRPEVVAVTPRSQLAAGRARLEQGQHARGRETLAALVRDRSVPLDVRAEAQTLIGESLQRQGDLAGAITAFEDAARLGAGRDDGATAIMSIARVYIRQGRTDDVRRTYLRYLDEYPLGPNRSQAREWICGHGGDPSVECGPR